MSFRRKEVTETVFWGLSVTQGCMLKALLVFPNRLGVTDICIPYVATTGQTGTVGFCEHYLTIFVTDNIYHQKGLGIQLGMSV